VDIGTIDFKSEKLIQLKKLLLSIIPLESNLSISGNSGTGKSTWALFALEKSVMQGQYNIVDAKELDEDRFKDELEKNQRRHVLIENIDYLHRENQNVLAQFLQKNTLHTKPVIITTSKRSLSELAQEGLIRQDLYYKLTVVKMELPDLKEIIDDIDILAQFYLKVFGIIYKKMDLSLASEALEKLKLYFWPGNISELENVLERAVLLTDNSVITDKNIRFDGYQKHTSLDLSLGMSLSEVERRLILQTLEHTENNRTKAAHILGISIRTLRNKLNEYREAGLI
jgi:two-component system, NtrC family, response regulator AtoC